MKKAFILASLLFVMTWACRKERACNQVTITQAGTPCGQWAINKNGNTYPVDSIPDIFKQEGIIVCAKYQLYEDLRLCACCGGTWAKIISMRNPDE